MASAVWKQPLTNAAVQEYDWPAGSRILHGEVQGETPCLWFACDPGEPRRQRRFVLLPTGGPFGSLDLSGWTHVATFMLYGGGIVAHLFEVDSDVDAGDVEEALAVAGKLPRPVGG